MDAKHTPGPWQIEGKYRGDDGSLYLSTMHPMPIFELVPIVGKEAEHLANARLIAAAPDLVEALRAIRKEARRNKPDPDQIWTLANDAIAKAEGR